MPRRVVEWEVGVRKQQQRCPLAAQRIRSMRVVAADPATARLLYKAAKAHQKRDKTSFQWHQYYRLGRFLPMKKVFIVRAATTILEAYKRKNKGSLKIQVEVSGRRVSVPLLTTRPPRQRTGTKN